MAKRKKIVAHILIGEQERLDKEGNIVKQGSYYGEDHVEGKTLKEVNEKLREQGIEPPKKKTYSNGIYEDDEKGESHRVGFVKKGRDKYGDTGKSFPNETIVTYTEVTSRPIFFDKRHKSRKKLKDVS